MIHKETKHIEQKTPGDGSQKFPAILITLIL